MDEGGKGRYRHIGTTMHSERARMRTIRDSQVKCGGAPMTMIQAILFWITEAFVLSILLALLLRWDDTRLDEDEKADWQNRY